MEDTLRELCNYIQENWVSRVLILVLMEDTLRVEKKLSRWQKISLNPCFNGKYSQSHYQTLRAQR